MQKCVFSKLTNRISVDKHINKFSNFGMNFENPLKPFYSKSLHYCSFTRFYLIKPDELSVRKISPGLIHLLCMCINFILWCNTLHWSNFTHLKCNVVTVLKLLKAFTRNLRGSAGIFAWNFFHSFTDIIELM